MAVVELVNGDVDRCPPNMGSWATTLSWRGLDLNHLSCPQTGGGPTEQRSQQSLDLFQPSGCKHRSSRRHHRPSQGPILAARYFPTPGLIHKPNHFDELQAPARLYTRIVPGSRRN